MNVAIFVDSYLPIVNGVVTSINQLKAGLEAEGNTVSIFTVDVPGAQPLEGVYRFPSIKFGTKTKSMYGLVSHRRVLRSLQELKIDLVHTHSEYSLGLAGKRAALELNLPLVHTNHTLWQHYTHYVPKFLLLFFKVEKTMARFMKGFKFVIAPSVKAESFFRPLSDPDATFASSPTVSIAKVSPRSRSNRRKWTPNERPWDWRGTTGWPFLRDGSARKSGWKSFSGR